MCVAAPPSDHDEKTNEELPDDCGDGALTEFDDPTITVREKGAAAEEAPTASSRPVGSVSKVRTAVRGHGDGTRWHGQRSKDTAPSPGQPVKARVAATPPRAVRPPEVTARGLLEQAVLAGERREHRQGSAVAGRGCAEAVRQ